MVGVGAGGGEKPETSKPEWDHINRARREAAHEILFLTNLVKDIESPSIGSLSDKWSDKLQAALKQEREFTRAELEARINRVADPQKYNATQAPTHEFAGELWNKLESCVETQAHGWAADVGAACETYLDAQPVWPNVVPRGVAWARRNATVIVTMIGAGAIAGWAPQVWSLLWSVDHGFLFFLCIFPVLVLLFLGRRTTTAAKRGHNRLSSLAAPSRSPFSVQPHPPAGGLPRLGEDSSLLPWLYVSLGLRISIYTITIASPPAIVWALTHFKHFGVDLGQAHVTAAIAVASLLAPIALARIIDVWDFFVEHWVRVRAMCIIAFAAIEMVFGEELIALLAGGIMLTYDISSWLLRSKTIGAAAPETSGVTIETAPIETAPIETAPQGHIERLFTQPNLLFVGVELLWLVMALNSIRLRERWSAAPRTSPIERIKTGSEHESWPAKHQPDEPVIVVLASGGGSRAAIYAALTFQALHTMDEGLGCKIQAISSVSGGSLAAAVYLGQRLDPNTDPCRGAQIEPRSDWLVDHVKVDFIRPTMWGAVMPFESRGAAVQDAFAQEIGHDPSTLRDWSIEQLTNAWREANEDGRSLPLPLFNTTTFNGYAMVISPFESAAFTDPDSDEERRIHDHYGNGYEDPTWVYWRDAIYGLDDLLPERDIELAEAVRASASFPFGFPPVVVQATWAPRYSPFPESQGIGEIKLTDGGALSNSGMWSMFHLLRNHVDQLQARGVIVVVIEASHMPSVKRNRLGQVLRNQAGLGQNLHRRMFQQLHLLYDGRLAIVQIDLPSRESSNAITSWVLPDKQIETLREDFGENWATASIKLKEAWRRLENNETVELELVRPPLD